MMAECQRHVMVILSNAGPQNINFNSIHFFSVVLMAILEECYGWNVPQQIMIRV